MEHTHRVRRTVEWLTKIAAANPRVSRTRLAAAILHKNRVISVGVNSYKSSPLQKKFGSNPDRIFLHAEINAIKNSLRYVDVDFLKKCELYICRLKNTNELGLSKPCDGCQRAIISFGLRRVFYTTDFDVEVMDLR